MGEHIEYEKLKSELDQKITASNERAVKLFNEGAATIEQSLGAQNGTALTGSAGATAKNTWTTLTEEYQKFSNYIQEMVDQANQINKEVSENEETIRASLENVDSQASGIAA